MAAPVWTLSVDLQTKTATFSTGLSDAAKEARKSFGDIRNSANEMRDGVRGATGATSYSMMEARHGVMMLGEEFGVHLPRGITTFIASIGPVGAAMEAAFPFLAIGLGATMLIESLIKTGEAARKLAEAQEGVALATDKSFAEMGDKILEAGAKLDELRSNHVAALKKELELIDHATLKDLSGEFEHLSGAVDKVFAALGHGFLSSFLTDVAGVQNAANQFKAQYLQDLAKGDQKAASDLLTGTLKSAQDALQGMLATGQTAEMSKTVQAQQQFIQMLQTQIDLQGQANTLNREQRDLKTEGEAKKAEDAANKRAALEAKVNAEIAKGRADLDKQLEAGADEVSKIMNFRLESGLKKELEADQEKLKGLDDQLKLQAELNKEAARHQVSMGQISAEQIVDPAQAENAAYAAKKAALEHELEAIDQNDKEKVLKETQLNNRLEELELQHQNRLRQIKEREKQMWADVATHQIGTLMRVAQGQQSAASVMQGAIQNIESSLIQMAVAEIAHLDDTKLAQAKHAARWMFNAGEHFPWPTNIVMAPALAALGFASVMAFERGGIVPGVERGDVVPAMLTPGEGVIPKPVMEGLTRAGDSGQSPEVHNHRHEHRWNIQAMDAQGFERVLQKHSDVVERHVTSHVRKMNH